MPLQCRSYLSAQLCHSTTSPSSCTLNSRSSHPRGTSISPVTISRTGSNPGATYFVTFRLGDSLPALLLDRWKTERDAWLSVHPAPRNAEDDREYHRLFSTRIEHWLDAGHGSCLLREPAHRDIVAQALAHFESERYRLLAWVIMPNHVHACFALHPACTLEKVIFSWKRQTARVINQTNGVTGSLWQHDYFDRIVRDSVHFGRVIRYIRNNPIKARLAPDQFTHWESDLARTL